MNLQTAVFLLLAAVALGSAYKVITSRVITHAVIFLALTFVAIAGVFLLLNAEFLAGAQVLIYAGAVTIVIVFAVMLSSLEEQRGGAGKVSFMWGRAGRWIYPVLAAVGFAGVMLAIYARTEWPISSAAPATDTSAALARELFTIYAIPFEIASVILLVAMVGAIILTMKEEEG